MRGVRISKKDDFDESKGAGDFDWSELLPKTFPVSLTKLNPYENNPRINEKAIPFVKRSINRFGFIVPIVVNDFKSLTIAAGHTRLAAALELCVVQGITQRNKGGMTETYLDGGTYLKSFYSVMLMPSAVKIGIMGDKHLRIHHNVDWRFCVPKIISQKWKKSR